MDYDISFFNLCRTMWTFEKDVELVSMVNAGARPDAAANYFNKTEERCISHLQVLKDNHRKYNEESTFIICKHKSCNLCLLFPSFKTKHLMGRTHANFQSIQRKSRAALALNTSHLGDVTETTLHISSYEVCTHSVSSLFFFLLHANSLSLSFAV